MTTADTLNRELTDDEIVELARFPLLERDKASREDYLLAHLVDMMGKAVGTPLALVTWPSGVKAGMQMLVGERTGLARTSLIAVYRAAETGYAGLVAQVVE